MTNSQNNEAPSDLSDIKRKLVWRMGFASLMIIGLLGGLALFDYMSAKIDNEPAAVHYTEPVPVAKKNITQLVTPATPVVEAEVEKKNTLPETSAAPADQSALKPPRPDVAAHPALPKVSPSVAKTPGVTITPVPAQATKPVDARGLAGVTGTPRSEASSEIPGQPSSSRLFSGFGLQAGVFADPRRAEELHARLILEGIPSTIEARVQVGPFKTRQEAEVARAKMKAMGIDAVMLMPKGNRH